MSTRFYVSRPIDGSRVVLDQEESHHLAKVMRLGPRAEITLFDGTGREFAGIVSRVGSSGVHVEVNQPQWVNRELPIKLTIAVGLPKGDRQKILVEKAVELGVHRLIPLNTQRGVAQPVPKAVARLRRSVIEASKQCGRNRLMVIAEPLSWADYAVSAEDAIRVFADPQATTPWSADWFGERLQQVGDAQGGPIASVVCGVGPEGGWSGAERQLADDQDWQPVRLGERILRVETAVLALAALIGNTLVAK